MEDDLPVPDKDESRENNSNLGADSPFNRRNNSRSQGKRLTDGGDRGTGSPRSSNTASNGGTDRRGFIKGLGIGAIGTGVIGSLGFAGGLYTADRFYSGGDAENATDDRSQGGPGAEGFGNGDGNGNDVNNETDTTEEPSENETTTGNDTEDTTPTSPDNESDNGTEDGVTEDDGLDDGDESSEEDTTTGIPEPDSATYMLEDEVEIDLNDLDAVYENSSVVMGVQDNGNLIAWNTEVENDEGYNPLWRFRSDQFPNREFYEVEGDHPIEELYEELDANIEALSEDMVNIFYNEDRDDGDWEDHSEYKEIEFEDLKNGLIAYGDVGQAQDYFFNRDQTLNNEEPTLETEWQELLQDGL